MQMRDKRMRNDDIVDELMIDDELEYQMRFEERKRKIYEEE